MQHSDATYNVEIVAKQAEIYKPLGHHQSARTEHRSTSNGKS